MENLAAKCRPLIPILVVLMLIPIVLHLWLGMLNEYGILKRTSWNLFEIGNDIGS